MLKSGGAGSGGKPDKSGGKLLVFLRTFLFLVGTNGNVPLFVPQSHDLRGGALWELHVELDEEKKKVVAVKKRLHGVAFRQSDSTGLSAASKRIISDCRGSVS